jgi:hypothetical protein
MRYSHNTGTFIGKVERKFFPELVVSNRRGESSSSLMDSGNIRGGTRILSTSLKIKEYPSTPPTTAVIG